MVSSDFYFTRGATHYPEPPLRWFVCDDQGSWRPVDWRLRNEHLSNALRQGVYPDPNRYVFIRTNDVQLW